MSEVRLNEVRSSLELTDGCIIDGDRDSVTFAIKVSRATLRANHHFLVAASEAATDARPPPALCEAPVRTVSHWGARFVKKLPTLLGLAASLAFLAIAGMYGYYSIVPAVAFQSIVPDKPTISVGEPLTLIITARHTRPCHVSYGRSVMRDSNDEVVVWADNHVARHQYGSDTFETFTSIVPLPLLLSGDYTLQITGDFDCGTLDDHTYSVLKLHFSIASE